MTISLQGMHTVNEDVEMCWWALTTSTAEYNNSEHQLIGTGMEDFFGNSFTLSRLMRTYHNDDVGLTHVHGGPQDHCPNSPGANFTTCADQFQTKPPERFSAYRMFDKDPLVFDDKLVLSVRYLPKGKCSLAPPYFEVEGGDQVGEAAGWGTRFDVYSWFYTYDRGE
jgi:hypothetical protein